MVDGANFIDGRWVPAASGSTFQRCNPADPDDVVGTFPASGPADVRAAVDALDKAAPEWADVAPERRAAILESAAAQLESSSTVLIAELVREEGKTTAEATMEVSRTPANLRFYAARTPNHRLDLPGRRCQPGVHPAGTRRHRRRDHAVELPAQHSVTQARSRRSPPVIRCCSSRPRSRR